ncbi:MAG: type VI secretion system tube protein Hcp [Ignavibacteriota bacterium]
MKTSSHIRIATMSLFALVVLSFASAASAVSINFAKITWSNGESKIVRCPDGACSVPDLKSGDYTVSIVDENGKPVTTSSFSVTCTVTAPRDAASGLATGKTATTTTDAMSHEIVSPRDPASGLPTGKRMHKPFVITKELDKSTPLLRFSTPTGPENADVTMWTLEVRVQRIEMK